MATQPRFDFTVTRGNSLPISVVYKAGSTPVDLTGYSAEFIVRRSASEDNTALIGPLDDAGGRITLGGVLGTVALTLTAEETLALIQGELNEYELRVTSGAGVPTTILKGRINAEYSALEDDDS